MTKGEGTSENCNVALVLDKGFGSHVEKLASRMPVWIVDSEKNDAAISALRARGVTSVTTLLPMLGESPVQILWRALRNIEDHHRDVIAAPNGLIFVYGVDEGVITPEMLEEFKLKRMTL